MEYYLFLENDDDDDDELMTEWFDFVFQETCTVDPLKKDHLLGWS